MVAGIVCFAEASDLDIEAESITGDPQTHLEATNAVIEMANGMVLRTDLLRLDNQAGTVHASGQVYVTEPGGLRLQAGELSYDLNSQILRASNQVSFSRAQGLLIRATEVEYNLATRTGSAIEAEIFGATNDSFFRAAIVRLEPNDNYVFEDAGYSACPADDPDWILRAQRISLNREFQVQLTSPHLQVGSTKLLPLPSFSFTIINQRQSGLLPQRLSLDSNVGLELDQPYYFNLAPNYDLIVGARMFTKRGIMAYLKPRWLFPNQRGSAEAGLIEDSEYAPQRYYWSFAHKASLGSSTVLELEAKRLSDDVFADDFLDSQSTNTRHFPSRAELTWTNHPWSARLLGLSHQSVFTEQDKVVKPYTILPQFELAWQEQRGPLFLTSSSSWTRFVRRSNSERFEARRLHARLAAHHKRRVGSAQVDFSAGAAGATYRGLGPNQRWLTPYLSTDVHYQLARPTRLFGRELIQVLVPRLFIAGVANSNFSDIPLLDTAGTFKSSESIYSIDRFVGGDRFEDTSFVSYGLDSYFRDSDNRNEIAFLRLGQQFHFNASNIKVFGEQQLRRGLGATVAEAHANFSPQLSVRALAILAQQRHWSNFQLSTRYGTAERIFDLSYVRANQREEKFNQGLISGNLWQLLNERTEGVFTINYDLNRNKVIKTMAGLRRKAACNCWQIELLVASEKSALGQNKLSFDLRVDLATLWENKGSPLNAIISSLREPLKSNF